MRKSWIVPLFLLVGIGASGQETDQETETITYYDNFVDYGNIVGYLAPLSDKEERVSSNAGRIIYDSATQLPDSVRICIEAAKDLWESRLGNGAELKLRFLCENRDDDNDIRIDVSYDPTLNPTIPACLLRYKNKTPLTGSEKADAIISINMNKEWNCSHNDESVSGSRNLTYSLLRSIAISLGFGSSVTEKTVNDKKIIAFTPLRGKYTLFDTFVFRSDGKKLSDIPNVGNRNNAALNEFVQPSGMSIYALKEDDEHKMYAPEEYDPFKSLVYLDNSNSLMYYDMAIGDKILQIDGTTLELLNAIGWEMEIKDVEIFGKDIPSSGITSAYKTNMFTAQNNTGSQLSDIRWSLTLPLKDGGVEIVAQQDGELQFEIPAIENEGKYDININGDIYGLVSFTANSNGVAVADTYRVSLEVKPQIKRVNIIRKESNAPYDTYNVYYTVEFYGAKEIQIKTREGGSPMIMSQFATGPFLAHVVTRSITKFYKARLEISAKNKYGKAEFSVDLPPFVDEDASYAAKTGSEALKGLTDSDIYSIDIYNIITGAKIKTASTLDQLETLKNGLYNVTVYDNDGNANQYKYIKK